MLPLNVVACRPRIKLSSKCETTHAFLSYNLSTFVQVELSVLSFLQETELLASFCVPFQASFVVHTKKYPNKLSNSHKS